MRSVLPAARCSDTIRESTETSASRDIDMLQIG